MQTKQKISGTESLFLSRKKPTEERKKSLTFNHCPKYPFSSQRRLAQQLPPAPHFRSLQKYRHC